MALNGKIAKAQSLTGNLVKSSGSGGDPNPVITRGSGLNSIISVNPSEPNVASGDKSIAIGTGNQATAKGAIAFGVLNLATAQNAIAIGNKIQNKPANQATNLGAIAIGSSTQATGLYAVSVGNQTIASGGAAFAAGNFTEASGTFGVATGYATEAEARYSAAFGNSTDATGGASFVIGAFNEPDANAVDSTHGQESRKYIFIVGNGTDDSNRSNAMTVDWDGNAVVAGKLTVGAAPVNAMDVATKQYVDQQGGGGIPGADGFSPIATVEQTASGATITITDKNGTTTANVLNGTATDAQVATAVDAWLEDNIAQETGYALDSSLTMSNAAAPADKVGDLKSAFSKAETEALTYVVCKNLYNSSEDTIGAYINSNGSVVVNGGAANVTGKIYAEIGRTIYISTNGIPNGVTRVGYYKADDTWTRNVDSTRTIELANGEAYFRVFYSNTMHYMQFEYDRVTAYEAYFAPYYKKCATVSELDNYALETDFEALETKVNGIEEDIPSYFEPQLESALDTIHKNLQAVGQNGESFVFFTDQHWVDNEKHSPALIRKILKNTTIKTVVCGGDILNEGTKAVELPRAMAFAQAMNGINYLYAFGNHDANAFGYTSDYTSPEAQANILTRNEVYALYESQLSNDQTIVWNTSSKPNIQYGVGNDYYIDKPCTKTRYLILDSGWYGWGQEASKSFVSSALASLGDGWHCVIVVHIPFINGGLSQYLTYCVFPNVTTYSSKVSAIVGGHTHYDMVLYTNEGIPIIVTDTDSLEYNHEHGNVATAGTITEQCIDIMTVDYDNGRVKCVRIGRGSDRIINAGINGVSSTITLIPSLADTVSAWVSDNASVATVANGTVTAIANGTCIITATYNSGTKESWFVSVSV